MKKIKNPLILLALGATAICGLAATAVSGVKATEILASIGDYTTDKATYYNSITSTGSALLTDLHNLMIDTHKTYTVYDDLKKPDYVYRTDPGSSSAYVTDFYTQKDIKKTWGSGSSGTWNREHVWAKSTSSGTFVETGAGADFQHLRPVESNLNSTRGSRKFGLISGRDSYKVYSSYDNALGGYKTGTDASGTFEPLDGAKGDVARIILYVYMHYSSSLGKTNDYTGPLSLTNIISAGSFDKAVELLVEWSLVDKVDETETLRNEVAASYQGNRNPFIDHPSYACKIWGTSSGVKTLCDKYDGWEDDPTPTKVLDKIEVSGTPSKTKYNVGDSFETAGLTVTAFYTDETTEDVTSKVTSSPNPLTEGTTSVTLSYSSGGQTKSVVVNGITVSSDINYGTLDNPLNLNEALNIIKNIDHTPGYTNKQIYCKATVKSIGTKRTDDYQNVQVTDGTNTVSIDYLKMTSDQFNNFAVGNEIVFHGYGQKYDSTTFRFANFFVSQNNYVTLDTMSIPVSSVSISNTKKDYYVGETCQINASVSPSGATDKTLTYSSNNTGVASVNSSGLVTFKAVGSATISAASSNGKTATITFNVTKAPVHVTQINVSLPSTSYYAGDTADLIYEVLPKDADNKNVTFESTNTSVATVNSEGEVNFIKAGSVTLKVISSDVSSVYGQVTVTVSERPAEDILVTDIVVDDSLSLLVNEESQISYQVIPTNATDKTVSWSSNNSKVATVDEDGVVKGLSEGTAIITVTANDANHVSKTINVEVTKPVEVIKVSQINVPSSITVKVNENANIDYEVLPENATDKSVTISSANDEIATINGTKVVGVSEGTTEITILSNDGGATASIPVTVTKGEEPVTKTIAEIAVVNLPDKTTYEIGEDFDQKGLVVNVNYTDGTEEDISSQVSLSEVDTSVSGTKTVEITYKTNYKTSFQIIVLEATVLSINIEKTPAKMNYFADEPLNTYGLVIKATMSDDSVIANVADMCTYTYDFATSNKVLISFSGKQLTMFVTLENVVQEKPVQHKAADFAYVFIEKLESKEPASVTQSEWDALQYYYNKLDTASKEFLKNYKVSSNGNGEVSAEVPEVDALKEFATKYDAIYSARKADGFTDFIGRASVQPIPGPTPTPTPSSDNKTLIIVIVVICVVAVALIAIIIPVEVKRSKRSKKNE